MSLQLRRALESDNTAIQDVIIAAFGDVQGREIADLLTRLVADPTAQPLLSIVATIDNNVVGHILFTNTRIQDSQRTISSVILAPLSVQPEYQNQGIGGRLIKEGLTQLKAAGVELVFVLGHPGYYPKYGFSTAGDKGFAAPYPIPPENADAWMVLELRPGIIGHECGRVICADALNEPRYWRE